MLMDFLMAGFDFKRENRMPCMIMSRRCRTARRKLCNRNSSENSASWDGAKQKERDVLVLRASESKCFRTQPPTPQPGANEFWGNGQFRSVDQPLFTDSRPFQGLAHYLEFYFGTVVVDQTGLTEHYNIDLNWKEQGGRDSKHTALKQALLDQLGLSLCRDAKRSKYSCWNK